MKKLLIVLALCVFAVSCCEVDHNNSQEKFLLHSPECPCQY